MSEVSSFRILVIDDNPAIHQDFIKILQPGSMTNKISALEKLNTEIFGSSKSQDNVDLLEIDTAMQGREGVELIKKSLDEHHPYAMAFVDIRMPPGWDGIETIKHIWALDKDIQVVICSAHSDYTWEQTVENLGKTDNLLILKKPFDNTAVRQLVCALTRKWQLIQNARKSSMSLKEQLQNRTNLLEKIQKDLDQIIKNDLYFDPKDKQFSGEK